MERERIQLTSKTVDQCHEKVFTLKTEISTFFEGIFTHRFRDVDEGIRAIIITTIGKWCEELPSEYLSDMYLKYLAWAMSDRVRNAQTKNKNKSRKYIYISSAACCGKCQLVLKDENLGGLPLLYPEQMFLKFDFSGVIFVMYSMLSLERALLGYNVLIAVL